MQHAASAPFRNSVIVALSVFYAMVISIFALVLELSHLLGTGENRRSVGLKDLFFGVYMYGASIAFLLYCYVVLLLNPRWKMNLQRIRMLECFKRNALFSESGYSSGKTVGISSEMSISLAAMQRKVSHDSPSAGSLFLRLGCVVFGVIGTVFYAFSVFLCASDGDCDDWVIVLDVLAIAFVFVQMHFIFCNWKLSITGAQNVARFGTMHLVATNLWTWIRYILLEESAMEEEIRQVFARNVSQPESTTGHSMQMLTTYTALSIHPHGLNSSSRAHHAVAQHCEGADCVLASMSEVMYTSIVEYSLIGAAVMFIVWRNINHERSPRAHPYVRRKHQIRMDCSKSSTGLFIGLAFLAATFTSMAVFSGYMLIGESQHAAVVFGATDIAQYVVATIGSLTALWQMRKLRYYTSDTPSSTPVKTASTVGSMHNGSSTTVQTSSTFNSQQPPSSTNSGSGSNPSQELLDMILLGLGMTGEMIYSVAGLLGLSSDRHWHPISVMLLAVHITRITEVGVQSCLIYIAGKLRIQGDAQLRKSQPGKQAITFLLLANISMFLMNLMEAEKAGISDSVVNFYGKKSWVFLVRSFSPLTIFYRFHSSVCLAEVWKNAYAWKE